jgi:hypothetical protein
MRKSKMRFNLCGRIMAIVILMSFLMTFRVYGGPPATPPESSEGNGMRRYSEYEVDCLAELDLLIEDLTGAAHEAIEQAAAEAAKAAALASLEREAAAIAEAQKRKREYMRVKAGRVKNAVMAGLIGFVSGAALSGVVIIATGGR